MAARRVAVIPPYVRRIRAKRTRERIFAVGAKRVLDEFLRIGRHAS
jgi:hypothetical protein